MEKKETNYARFYTALNRVKDDKEEVKRMVVQRYTHGRTDSVRAMRWDEYNRACDDLERLTGDYTWKEKLRKHRSTVLKIMQKMGVDTTNWDRVNALCEDRRIAGKQFYRLSVEELDTVAVKLMAIARRGGLKPKPITESRQMEVVVMIPQQQNPEKLN